MTPIATIFRDADGNFKIISSEYPPLSMARVMAAIMPNLLEQAANPPVAAPVELVAPTAEAEPDRAPFSGTPIEADGCEPSPA